MERFRIFIFKDFSVFCGISEPLRKCLRRNVSVRKPKILREPADES